MSVIVVLTFVMMLDVLCASVRAYSACEHMRDAKLRIFLYVAKFL